MSADAAAPQVSPLGTFTTAVNFVLGAGVLGLPFAVASAGLCASVVSLIIVTCIASQRCQSAQRHAAQSHLYLGREHAFIGVQPDGSAAGFRCVDRQRTQRELRASE